jgi:alpha,alpha-trehalase
MGDPRCVSGLFRSLVADSLQVLSLGTANSNGYRRHDIRGTYALANLLQELTIAQDFGRKHIILDEARLTENPVARLHRLIKTSFWDGLTRRIDGTVIETVTKDPKAERMKDPRPRIYVPYRATDQLEYYQKVAKDYPELNLDVVRLPEVIDAEYTYSELVSQIWGNHPLTFPRHQ